jgi:hypothetical protein
VPTVLALLALPFGFVDEEIAVAAGALEIYFFLPGVVAWCLDAFRTRLPRWVQRVVGAVIIVVAIPYVAFWLLWLGPFFVLCLPATAVVFIVACRLLRARPSGRVGTA